ncbi:MAG: tRNA 2-thiouridine(34) synthase MnmA [Proteobacteria bacterium]|nr:tRNA 2-thiouridine(34) synthase MnmA [Pseudomonadota bacterium]
MGNKVCVAMSGGVDSSTTAGILKSQGFDVFGVFMKLWDAKGSDRGCCTLNDSNDALRVANKLNIPFYVLNFKEEFKEHVIDYFVSEYKRGRTPNPCIMCNRAIKFEFLLNKVKTFGADYIATGHYTRIENFEGKPFLFKAYDKKKDQSYFLFNLKKETLSEILFPLGRLSKDEVRKKAEEFELITARKRESQEICFIEKDYRDFLKEMGIKEKKGYIVDLKGKVLGTHRGFFNFTIGQRSGLNIAVGKPVYVIKIIPEENLVVVGDDANLYRTTFIIEDVNFFEVPNSEKDYETKIRYTHKGERAKIKKIENNKFLVEFVIPQRGITPGQACVFYDNERLIGGGWIKEVL